MDSFSSNCHGDALETVQGEEVSCLCMTGYPINLDTASSFGSRSPVVDTQDGESHSRLPSYRCPHTTTAVIETSRSFTVLGESPC